MFLGLVGLLDPPREGVRDAIAECRAASTRVVMITGDQPATVRYVAQEVGLVDDAEVTLTHGRDLRPAQEMQKSERRQMLQARVFAGVDPAQKLDLISLHQDAGMVVR